MEKVSYYKYPISEITLIRNDPWVCKLIIIIYKELIIGNFDFKITKFNSEDGDMTLYFGNICYYIIIQN